MRTLLLLLALYMSFFAKAQDDYTRSIQEFQDELNADYRDPAKSPLDSADLAAFQELPFFPIDQKYTIKAHFLRTPNEKAFEMPTTTKRRPMYVIYGVASFMLDGRQYSMNIYQNLSLAKKEAYKDYLMLPFSDMTNGVESYGGGRYVDLKIPDSDSILIDFNKAYNPYCAYSHRFSCLLVPQENNINRMIPVGVKLNDDWNMMKLKDLGFSIRFPGEPIFKEYKPLEGMTTEIKQFRYLGEFMIDSNYVFQMDVKHYSGSTCPQRSANEYNECFKDILSEKLELTGGALMFLQQFSMQGHDAYDFELLAQGKAFTKYRVVLVENTAYIASVITIYKAHHNENMDKFFNSFRMLK